MKLGIVYKNDKIINHRSFIKVVLNPILRYYGYQIATLYHSNNTLGKAVLERCEKVSNIKWEKYDTEYDFIIKKNDNIMEVFVVIGEYGSWDSYHTKILKVFSDEQKAKDFVEEYNNSDLIKKSKEISRKMYYDGDEDDDGNIIEPLSEDDKKWKSENPLFWEVYEFNKCRIEIFNLE